MANPTSMRALSKYQARKCEDAKTPGCKCRCGGTLHGISGSPVAQVINTYLHGKDQQDLPFIYEPGKEGTPWQNILS